jgi:ribosomal protein S14
MLDNLHYLNYKDNRLRNILLKNELLLNLYKSCLFDLRIKLKYRFYIKNKCIKYNKVSKIHSRCVFSGRSRFVFKYYHLNRNSLKFFSAFGYISGFKKY